MAKSFLTALSSLVPSWLYDNVTKSHAMILDEYYDRARAGLEARFPSRAQPDALSLIGDDRGIPRGRAETDDHYAQRLIGWRYPRGHRVRGSAFALLNQVSEYFGGIDCWTIDVNGNRHYRTAAGVESFVYGYPWPWDTDTRKGRFWIVIKPGSRMSATPSFGDPTLWGGAVGTPGYSIGQLGAVPDDKDAIAELFDGAIEWKPAGTIPQWLIVDLDGGLSTPSVDWVNWSKNAAGTQVATRYAGARYWALFAGINDYTGKITNYPTLFTEPNGGTYGGSATSFPALITLADGTTYAGSTTNFPTTIPLVDDGDQP